MIYLVKTLEDYGYAIDRKGLYDILDQFTRDNKQALSEVDISFQTGRIAYKYSEGLEGELEIIRIDKFQPNLDAEIWAFIPGTDRMYMASSLGRIKRLKASRGDKDEKLLNISSVGRGMDPVATIKIKGHFRSIPVHILVGRAFLGVKNGAFYHRKDGNRNNCRLENLQASDKQEYLKSINTGEGSPSSLYTNEFVKEIRESYAREKRTFRKLADDFNIPWHNVRRIIKGECYPDAGGPIFKGRKYKRLTDSEAVQIVKGRNKGLTNEQLADQFDVSVVTISNVCTGRTKPKATKHLRK